VEYLYEQWTIGSFYRDCLMQKPHFDTSVSYTVYYHLHNKTIKIHGHIHSIFLVISTTGVKRIEAKLTQKNRIVKRWYIVKVASNDSICCDHIIINVF
jgi:hypothetical protein